MLPLPRSANLEHLKKSAKQLLAAHRAGDPRCCPFLRRLHRFADAGDEEILAASLSLHDVQHLLALVYGFPSWQELRRHILAGHKLNALSLEAVRSRSRQPIPPYADAGVPMAVVAALNHAGVDIDFHEFAAASGWAFSFGYRYETVSPAYLAVRGRPGRDGPFEIFAALPAWLGFGYNMARTDDPEALWSFARTHVDTGTPIMSEHLDGGLITGYREHEGRRRLFFDGTAGRGWIDIDAFQPYAVYVLVKERPARPHQEILRLALARAAAKGSSHRSDGVPQGMEALEAYLADVGDPDKDFAGTQEWFCWAAFSRLMARRCARIWLASVADELGGPAAVLTRDAAERYEQAAEHYDRFRQEIARGESAGLSFHERARSPEKISRFLSILREGVRAEAAGLSALGNAVATLSQP